MGDKKGDDGSIKDKEVKINLNKQVKKNIEFDIWECLKKGLNPKKISIELNVSLQNISYYLRRFKSRGVIERKGYGVWEVKTLTNDTFNPKKKEVRGHAFIWKVKLPKGIDWLDILVKKNIEFKQVGIKNTPRILIEKRKIWLGKRNIIIYEPISYLAESSIECRKLAVYKLMELIRRLEEKFAISLKTSKGYLFTPRREHYSLIKNDLAIQCNRNQEKIYVYDKYGWWFCIDDSYNLSEAENKTTKQTNGLTQNIYAQKFFNSQKKTDWKVTPEFVLESLGKMLKVQEMNSQNIVKHQRVLDEMLITLKMIQKKL
jgi:predicted transcriptional regulator